MRQLKQRSHDLPGAMRLIQVASRLWENAARTCIDRFDARRHRGNGRALAIFVQAGSASYPRALEEFRKIWAPFQRRGCEVVIVDNAPDRIISTAMGEHFLAGSNLAWEFSGWQEGIDFWEAQGGYSPAWIVCVNSSFLKTRHWNSVARWVNPYSLSRMPSAMLGRVWTAPDGSECYGRRTPQFVETSLFALPGSLVSRIKFVSVGNSEMGQISPSSPLGESLFLPDAPVSASLRADLETHLFDRWYAGGRISDANFALLRGKLQAILNERLLSAQVTQLGVRLAQPLGHSRVTGLINGMEYYLPEESLDAVI